LLTRRQMMRRQSFFSMYQDISDYGMIKPGRSLAVKDLYGGYFIAPEIIQHCMTGLK
jgi:hypothetical protein